MRECGCREDRICSGCIRLRTWLVYRHTNCCCICAGDPCWEEWCRQCFHENRETGEVSRNEPPNAWPCQAGGCPECGGIYVEWLSSTVSSTPGSWRGRIASPEPAWAKAALEERLRPVAPADVYLRYEVFGEKPTRRLPEGNFVTMPRRGPNPPPRRDLNAGVRPVVGDRQ